MMARYNEILVGRYNRFLQKFLSIKGGPPSPQLATEIMATWAMFHGEENRYLEGWNIFGGSPSLAPSAGNQNAFLLRNPSGSNVVVVVYRMLVATETTAALRATVSFGAVAANLGGGAFGTFRFDNRGNPNSTALGSFVQAAAPADLSQIVMLVDIGIAAGSLPQQDILGGKEIPILPGDGIQVRYGTVNTSGFASFWWRERFLEDSERT